jgi:hypothetical protein
LLDLLRSPIVLGDGACVKIYEKKLAQSTVCRICRLVVMESVHHAHGGPVILCSFSRTAMATSVPCLLGRLGRGSANGRCDENCSCFSVQIYRSMKLGEGFVGSVVWDTPLFLPSGVHGTRLRVLPCSCPIGRGKGTGTGRACLVLTGFSPPAGKNRSILNVPVPFALPRVTNA